MELYINDVKQSNCEVIKLLGECYVCVSLYYGTCCGFCQHKMIVSNADVGSYHLCCLSLVHSSHYHAITNLCFSFAVLYDSLLMLLLRCHNSRYLVPLHTLHLRIIIAK